ncbi:hypothetical protein CASFOL_008914 [Castilleja foliolosa]|uniref:RNase H type-1 domain-containing protein n=1 Tax=Castilleja foliolosa TaxID=1961234 RepID=A0ABD3E0E4_9LAMI
MSLNQRVKISKKRRKNDNGKSDFSFWETKSENIVSGKVSSDELSSGGRATEVRGSSSSEDFIVSDEVSSGGGRATASSSYCSSEDYEHAMSFAGMIRTVVRTIASFPVEKKPDYTCHLCQDGPFDSKKSLKEHYEIVHPGIYNSSKPETICRCGCYFGDEESFDRHVDVCALTNWEPPERGVIKLNTDGGCKRVLGASKGNSGGGGLLRDNNGTARLFFLEPFGVINHTLAEMHSMDRGLSFILRSDFKKAVVETDSKHLVDLLNDMIFGTKNIIPADELSYMFNICTIKKKDLGNEVYHYLLLKIRSALMDPNILFIVRHVYREANGAANALAELAQAENELRIHDTQKYLPDESIDRRRRMILSQSYSSNSSGMPQRNLSRISPFCCFYFKYFVVFVDVPIFMDFEILISN